MADAKLGQSREGTAPSGAEKKGAPSRLHGSARKQKRFAAAGDGPGVQLVDWARSHGALSCLLLAIVCAAAIGVLFWFVVFSDFSASADFIYNQF